jgi:hypothetical protein
MDSKTNRLKLGNTTVDTKRCIIIGNYNDNHDITSSLINLRTMRVSPRPTRVFNYPLGKRQALANVKAGIPARWNQLCPIGKSVIGKWNKGIANKCGFDNPEKCTRHAGHRYFVSALVNVSDVPLLVNMTVVGHKTTSAHIYDLCQD